MFWLLLDHSAARFVITLPLSCLWPTRNKLEAFLKAVQLYIMTDAKRLAYLECLFSCSFLAHRKLSAIALLPALANSNCLFSQNIERQDKRCHWARSSSSNNIFLHVVAPAVLGTFKLHEKELAEKSLWLHGSSSSLRLEQLFNKQNTPRLFTREVVAAVLRGHISPTPTLIGTSQTSSSSQWGHATTWKKACHHCSLGYMWTGHYRSC